MRNPTVAGRADVRAQTTTFSHTPALAPLLIPSNPAHRAKNSTSLDALRDRITPSLSGVSRSSQRRLGGGEGPVPGAGARLCIYGRFSQIPEPLGLSCHVLHSVREAQ